MNFSSMGDITISEAFISILARAYLFHFIGSHDQHVQPEIKLRNTEKMEKGQ